MLTQNSILFSQKGSNQMKILLCDDNLRFAEKTANFIDSYYRSKSIPTMCFVTSSPTEVLSRQDIRDFDVAFLDADMKPINGIEVGRFLKSVKPEIILVFISAFLEFAPQGYTVNTFRYILKNDLRKTLPLCLDEIVEQLSISTAYFTFKNQREIFKLPYREIYYFQSELRKVNIFGVRPNVIIASFYSKLSDIVDELKNHDFLQTSKRDLINMSYIQSISSYRVTLTNGIVMGVSRNEYSSIKECFIEWRGRL